MNSVMSEINFRVAARNSSSLSPRRAASKYWDKPCDGIRLLDLPVPRTIELPEPLENFGRMAVALGLSYPPTEIGRIVPMRDIEDIPPPVVADPSERFVSKDQV